MVSNVTNPPSIRVSPAVYDTTFTGKTDMSEEHSQVANVSGQNSPVPGAVSLIELQTTPKRHGQTSPFSQRTHHVTPTSSDGYAYHTNSPNILPSISLTTNKQSNIFPSYQQGEHENSKQVNYVPYGQSSEQQTFLQSFNNASAPPHSLNFEQQHLSPNPNHENYSPSSTTPVSHYHHTSSYPRFSSSTSQSSIIMQSSQKLGEFFTQ